MGMKNTSVYFSSQLNVSFSFYKDELRRMDKCHLEQGNQRFPRMNKYIIHKNHLQHLIRVDDILGNSIA